MSDEDYQLELAALVGQKALRPAPMPFLEELLKAAITCKAQQSFRRKFERNYRSN